MHCIWMVGGAAQQQGWQRSGQQQSSLEAPTVAQQRLGE